MAAAPDLKTLGRYNIERVLGKGAMGVVYEGVDPRLGRRVAIKTILKSHLDEDTGKDFAMRFVREAQAVARLNHPNIVQVYDFGEEGDIAYLVMEFIKGKELKNFFDANERFDLKEVVRIMSELCEALDFAHHAGIVHRDIKPANVMLDSQARTKLTDFGVARVQDSDKTSVERTQAGTMVGTPAYMSPEQITGGTIDKRTDVFSAGIILYQFLTGEKPFTGSGAWTIAKKIIQEEPPLPSSINTSVTPLFDAVVNKALAKDPEQRYQSARDLAIGLRKALDGKADADDDSDRTVVGPITAPGPAQRPAPAAKLAAAPAEGTGAKTGSQSQQEVELEFWRAIKDGNDPDDFDLYVQQFPTGIYAALAKRKIAKLRGVAPEETGAKAKEQEKKEAEEATRREAEVKGKLEAEKARLEAEMARKEEEYKKREAEREAEAKARAEANEQARLEAIEKAKQEAEKARQEAAAERERAKQEAAAELAKREAEYKKREAEAEARLGMDAKTRAAAEEKARLEAVEKAKQEAAAELAKREAEYKKREADAEAKRQAAEKARADAEAKAKAEAEAKAKQEAALRAKQEAEARVKREAEEKKARAEAEARAKAEAEAKAKREAEFAKREAELKKQLAEAEETMLPGARKKSPVVPVIIGVLVVAIGGGAWYALAPKESGDARVAELQKQLAESKKREGELQKAREREAQAVKELELARQREEQARKSGDVAKQKELAEQTKLREAEAKKQSEVTRAREVDAAKQKELAEKSRAEQAKLADAKKSAAEKAAQDKAEARLAAERAAAGKASAEAKAAIAQANAEKAAAEKAVAEARAAADKAKQEQAKVTVAAAPTSGDALFSQAASLEQEGKGREAVKMYTQAARAGNGKAAKRLGEIFDKGLVGISRDYAESLKWYNAARVLGEDVPMQKNR
jgi:serine/threonine-protein kinase